MQALEGTTVVDLSRLLPGPMCTWYLQGLGAKVIKVESPGGGDYMRHLPPFDHTGTGIWFAAVNAGKRSVVLDLRRKTAIHALKAMLRRADVLVESFRPGVLASMGLDPRELLTSHPRLVIASITGFGQSGPWSHQPGHDIGFCALAGLLSLQKRHHGVPDLPGAQVADLAGGALTGALTIVAALLERERSGQGQWLDISMTESAMALMAPVLAATALTGKDPSPGSEALTGGLPAYGIYRCADGRLLTIAAIEPKFWQKLCQVVGSDLPMERGALEAIFATRPRDLWVELLDQTCAAPLLDPTEVLQHPLHRQRGSISGHGAQSRVRPPFAGAKAHVLAPRLGEHTRQELQAAGVEASSGLWEA